MNTFNGSIVILALLAVVIPAGLAVTCGLKQPRDDTSQMDSAMVNTNAVPSNSPAANQGPHFSELAVTNMEKTELPGTFDSASATSRVGNHKQAPVTIGNAALNPEEPWNQGASIHMSRGDVLKDVETDELVTRSTYPYREIGLDLDYTDGLENGQAQVAIDLGADIYVESID